MKRLSLLAIAAALIAGPPARAADEVRYAPAPAWVKPVAVPDAPPDKESGAAQVLLQDDQARFGEADEFYTERAMRVVSPQALAGGNVIRSWNPETETLTVHKLQVIRDKQVIDVLAGGKKLTVLRRETSLERATLDGNLTATIQPEDLRVGDILDYAITVTRKDPVMQGRSEGFAALQRQAVVVRSHVRAIWPAGKPIRWRATVGLPEPKLTKTRDGTELEVGGERLDVLRPPRNAPPRFRRIGQLEMTEFADWAQVSALMAPLYRKAATLKPDSPLKAEAAKIKAASNDPKTRAQAALKLVEDQTRYVFLGMNLGGYTPADADVTWTRRFGDCKGKTALLLALLNELGIEAEPAFVSSSDGDGMDERLPMVALFDHVLVRARIGGKTYWLDGTRLGDRGLDDIPPPGFHWALPVQAAGGALEPILRPPFTTPQTERLVDVDLTGGLDGPAPVHVEYVTRGEAGAAMKLLMERPGQALLDRALREMFTGVYPWIVPKAVGWSYDDKAGAGRMWMDGTGTLTWRPNGSVRDLSVEGAEIGGDVSYQRQPGPNQDAPFTVVHPLYDRTVTSYKLPANAAAIMLAGAPDVNQTIAGVAYKRISRLKDRVATVEVERRSLVAEFPAAEADADAAIFRALGQTTMALRASQASFTTAKLTEAGTPADAVGWAARGASGLLVDAFDKAIASFTRAMELEPKAGKYVYDRGAAYYQMGEDAKAVADFNRALALDPKDELSLMARADLSLQHGDERAAARDYDEAARVTTHPDEVLRRRADAYRDAGRLEPAIADYDAWLKAYPANPRVSEVRGRRCVARARLGRDARAVLAECDAAAAGARTNSAPEGKAMSLLRLGRLDEAATAYAALARDAPKDAGIRYGLGVARLRKGMKAEGEADLKAAVALDPAVAGQFKRYGLAP